MKRYPFFWWYLSKYAAAFDKAPLTTFFFLFYFLNVLVILETHRCFLRCLTCGLFRLCRCFFLSEREKEWKGHGRCAIKHREVSSFLISPTALTGTDVAVPFFRPVFWHVKVQSGRMYEAISSSRWVGTNCLNPGRSQTNAGVIMQTGWRPASLRDIYSTSLKAYLPKVYATLGTDQNAFKTKRVWLIRGEVQRWTLPRIREGYYCLNALEVY